MEAAESKPDLSKEPVSILFNPSLISKKNVWDVNLEEILDLLVRILEKKETVDLRVAGMAALTSSLIYRLKVESIFALHKTEDAKPPTLRRNVDIKMIGIPYRHESTHAVSFDELLEMLENLIGAMANPRTQRRRQGLGPVEAPDFDEYMLTFDNVVTKYKDLVVSKIRAAGTGLLSDVVSSLDTLDSIRCFLAILFLAKDGRAELEQVGEDIRVTLVGSADNGGAASGATRGQ